MEIEDGLPTIPWSQIMLINTHLVWGHPVKDCFEIREVSDGGRCFSELVLLLIYTQWSLPLLWAHKLFVKFLSSVQLQRRVNEQRLWVPGIWPVLTLDRRKFTWVGVGLTFIEHWCSGADSSREEAGQGTSMPVLPSVLIWAGQDWGPIKAVYTSLRLQLLSRIQEHCMCSIEYLLILTNGLH